MTKMWPCSFMLKTFKNLILQNQKSYDLETWHAALGSQALQSTVYINDDHGLTFAYFMARLNLVSYAFELGKLSQSHLMVKTCSK